MAEADVRLYLSAMLWSAIVLLLEAAGLLEM
jgi:hypothetical protein